MSINNKKKDCECSRCKSFSEDDLVLASYVLKCFKNIAQVFPKKAVYLKFLLADSKGVQLVQTILDDNSVVYKSDPSESPSVHLADYKEGEVVSSYEFKKDNIRDNIYG